MILGGQIKLSRIFDHNFDKNTDRLYQPLRTAVDNIPTNTHLNSINQQSTVSNGTQRISELRCSKIHLNHTQQNIIRQSTYIPINKKLVQTINPQKCTRVRSKSYRSISVTEKICYPMSEQFFKNSKVQPGKKTQIVYEYDTNNVLADNRFNSPYEYYGASTPMINQRSRSMTYTGPKQQNFPLRLERAETKHVQIKRKPSSNSSTSIKLDKNVVNQKQRNPQGQYYENCTKYTFKKDEKNSRRLFDRSDSDDERMKIKAVVVPRHNEYKYNLFNMLDDPINTKCSAGSCGSSNEIIASKVKKRW